MRSRTPRSSPGLSSRTAAAVACFVLPLNGIHELDRRREVAPTRGRRATPRPGPRRPSPARRARRRLRCQRGQRPDREPARRAGCPGQGLDLAVVAGDAPRLRHGDRPADRPLARLSGPRPAGRLNCDRSEADFGRCRDRPSTLECGPLPSGSNSAGRVSASRQQTPRGPRGLARRRGSGAGRTPLRAPSARGNVASPITGSPSAASPEPDTGDHLGGTHRDEGPSQGFERLRPEPFEGAGHRPEPERHRQLAVAVEMRQDEGHGGAERNTEEQEQGRRDSNRQAEGRGVARRSSPSSAFPLKRSVAIRAPRRQRS